MSEYLTEAQQVEALKKFWKENGFTIVASIILAILLVTGIRFYRNYIQTHSQQASVIYQHMIVSTSTQNTQDAQTQANLLIKNYASTPYAKFAALFLAKQDVDNQKYDDAITQLNWVIKHNHSKFLAQTARIRLARIYLQQNDPQNALKTASSVKDKSFQALADEIQGDAFVKLGQLDQARTAYQNALAGYQTANINRQMVLMKLNDLPGEIAAK